LTPWVKTIAKGVTSRYVDGKREGYCQLDDYRAVFTEQEGAIHHRLSAGAPRSSAVAENSIVEKPVTE
jgi:hypothetical protein